MPTLLTNSPSRRDIVATWSQAVSAIFGRDPDVSELRYDRRDLDALSLTAEQIMVVAFRLFDLDTEPGRFADLIAECRDDVHGFVEPEPEVARAEYLTLVPSTWLARGQAELLPVLEQKMWMVKDSRTDWPQIAASGDLAREELAARLAEVEVLA